MDETLQGRVESKLARVAELNAQKDAMSDTTGWEKRLNGYEKKIGPHWFRIWWVAKKFHLGWPGNGQVSATRPTLRECQILAHDTARLWAGES